MSLRLRIAIVVFLHYAIGMIRADRLRHLRHRAEDFTAMGSDRRASIHRALQCARVEQRVMPDEMEREAESAGIDDRRTARRCLHRR